MCAGSTYERDLCKSGPGQSWRKLSVGQAEAIANGDVSVEDVGAVRHNKADQLLLRHGHIGEF